MPVIGLSDFAAALERWIARTEVATAQAMQDAGQIVDQEMAASFGDGHGPTSRSGALAVSNETTIEQQGDTGYVATMGPRGLEYVRKVEMGKRGRHSGPPHPFFGPGWQRSTPRFADSFVARWGGAAPGSP